MGLPNYDPDPLVLQRAYADSRTAAQIQAARGSSSGSSSESGSSQYQEPSLAMKVLSATGKVLMIPIELAAAALDAISKY
mgnify:CR=1 FL=1